MPSSVTPYDDQRTTRKTSSRKPRLVASVDQRIEWKDSLGRLATPSNISRRLRELAVDGVLEVQIKRATRSIDLMTRKVQDHQHQSGVRRWRHSAIGYISPNNWRRNSARGHGDLTQ